MIRIKKIVSVDNTKLESSTIDKFRELADEVIIYEDYPNSNAEIISRAKDADVLLVSWNTTIDQEVIKCCPELRYIGMCCSLYDEKSANVDIKAANKQGIIVLGVRDYGDEGTIEFILSQLIRLLHGFGEQQWKEETTELTKQKLGIIGLGATGKMLAERAKAFGMEVFYYSRTRKPFYEEQTGIKYLELNDLLRHVDILSTHLPKKTVVLDEEQFKQFGQNKILINTSLGPTFQLPAFEKWIANQGNYAIFDKSGLGDQPDQFSKYDNVLYSEKVSGWTSQAKRRLSVKVLENINKFLEQC